MAQRDGVPGVPANTIDSDPRDLDEYAFGARIHAVLFPSAPIQSREFLFGRDDQLDRIRRSLMAPGRQVFIYGERGVGKSSLANAAAFQLQSSDALPIHVSGSSSSTFPSIVGQLIRKTETESSGTRTVKSEARVHAGWVGAGRAVEVTSHAPIDPVDIDEAAQRLSAAFERYSQTTVAVIDEFDQIPSSDERNRFAQLVKALGDTKSRVKLIFTGVATALDELLESHGSAMRQFDTVELERLSFQACLDILQRAADEFGVYIDPSIQYRIASVSNGFPYYVHLLSEHLLWAWYSDRAADQLDMSHLHVAFGSATAAVHASLRQSYDQAVRGREHMAQIVWATADAYDLERPVDSIWRSYEQICDTLGADPILRSKLPAELRKLRSPQYGSILESVAEKRLYRFSEAMVRGYVRMAAACRNIQLNDESFDPPPQITARGTRVSGRKRWLDLGRFIPNIDE